jgi:hypothetical protein
MISLRSFCDLLSPYVGINPNGLYERQRALTKIGALPAPVRGRGYGLLASPDTVAPILTALMATDNLSNIARAFWTIGNLPCSKGEVCRLTGKGKFNDAIIALLNSSSLAQRVISIQVYRADHAATISFSGRKAGGKQDATTFGKPKDFPDRLEVTAVLWGHVLEKIAQLLQSAMEEN